MRIGREAANGREPAGSSALAGVRSRGPLDHPGAHDAKDLDPPLTFLAVEEARAYELSNVEVYSLTLRAGSPDNSSVLYTTGILEASRDKRYTLYWTLHAYARRMLRLFGEKLSLTRAGSARSRSFGDKSPAAGPPRPPPA